MKTDEQLYSRNMDSKGVNKPKRTPGHKTKSHMVLAAEGHNMKLIRFWTTRVYQVQVRILPQLKDKARKKSYYARHNAQGKGQPTKLIS